MAITVVLWHQKRLVGDFPFHSKFALQLTHPFEKRQLWQISAYNASTVKVSEKVQLSRIESRPQAFQRAMEEMRTSPLSPLKSGSNSEFVGVFEGVTADKQTYV